MENESEKSVKKMCPLHRNILIEDLIAENWNLKEIENFLEQDSSWIRKSDSALSYAVQCGSPDVINLLLKYGARINRSIISDDNTLIVALENSREASVIRVLLENGADVNTLIGFARRRTTLCIALSCGASKDVVQLLLDAGCPLNGCPSHGSVFHCAIGDEIPCLKEDILQLLLERGAKANAFNFNGQSVMCYALWMGTDIYFLKMLLNMGSSLSACDKHTSAIDCVTNDSFRPILASVVKLLLDNGAPKNELHSNGLTTLQRILKSAEYETGAIRLLLEDLPDINVVDSSNNNLLNLAVGNLYDFKPSVVSLLIKRGVQVDTRNSDGRAPLHHAAMRDKCGPSVLKLLLQNGAKLHVMDRSFKTPVMLAMEFSQPMSKVRVLLANGVHIEVLMRSSERYMPEYLYGEYWRNRGLKYEYFKILAKYSLLIVPNFDVERYPNLAVLLKTPQHRAFVRKFMDACLEEVHRMSSLYVSKFLTLKDFIIKYSAFQKEWISEPKLEIYDCNLLLRIKAGDEFPIYKDIIWDKVDRAVMNEVLLKIPIYAVKAGKKIVLGYNDVLEIIEYVEDDTLLELIIAFNNEDAQASSSLKLVRKRCAEESGMVRKKALKTSN